jgi:hypothetical protein
MLRPLFITCALTFALPVYAEPTLWGWACSEALLKRLETNIASIGDAPIMGVENSPTKPPIVRFTAIQAFGESPALTVRLDSAITPRSAMTIYDFRRGGLTAKASKIVDTAALRKIERSIRLINFAPPKQTTVYKNGPSQKSAGATLGIRDGDFWIIETRLDEKYRCIAGSAHGHGAFRNAGLAVLKLAKRDAGDYR